MDSEALHSRPAACVVTAGLTCLDYRFSVDHFPPPLRREPVRAYREALGGPAAAAAVAVARLGGQARLCSRRGGDPAGDRLEAILRSEKVDVRGYRRFPGAGSPLAAVFVTPDGERYLFPHLEVGLPSSTDWIPPAILEAAQALLVDLRWYEGALELARRARRMGLPVVVDFDRDAPPAWQLLEHATHVIADEDLALGLGGVEALLDRLAAARVWGAVTLGSRGVQYSAGLIPAFPLTVKDTTGAGDVFHGAFALALAQGRTEPEALRFASAAAGLHCHLGQTPHLEQVLDLLQQRP